MVFWTIPSAYRILFIGIPDCQVICCLESWTRTVAAQRSRRRQHFFFGLEKWRWILHVIACYTGQTMINPRFTKIFERVGTKVDLHGNPEWVATEGCGGCSTFWSFPSPNHTESFRILSPTSFARMFFWTPCWELIAFACHPDFLWKSPSIFTYFHTIAVQLYNYRYSLYQHDWGAHHRIWPWLSHLTIWQVLLKIRLVVPSTRY